MAGYLKRRKGQEGFFFQRSVPPDCRSVIGKATWIGKSVNSATEAKVNAAVFLAETEQVIRETRGQQITPTQKLLSLLPQREDIPSDMDARNLVQEVSREPIHLDDRGSINPRYVELHELLGECFETSLRQQLQSGEFNAAMLGEVLEWLKVNNISLTEDADDRLKSLASVFRDSSSDGFFSYLDGVGSREV